MPFKDPEKEKAWRIKYKAEHPDRLKAAQDKYRAKNRKKRNAYMKEYLRRPEVREKQRQYYLEHREELLRTNKKNRFMKKYEQQQKSSRWKHCESSRNSYRRKKLGIIIQRAVSGYFWKCGRISNGPFNYRAEAIKDAEEAFK